MTTKANWSDLLKVVRGLSDRETGPPITGKLVISDTALLLALQACVEASDTDTHLYVDGHQDSSTLALDQTVAIEISTPRIGFGLLVSDIDALLKTPSARIKEPAHFLLLIDLVSETDAIPDDHLLMRYRTVLSLIQMLKRAAAFLDPEEQALVFIRDGKFEVPIDYSADDLRNLSLDTIRELTAALPAGTHEKQCATIMAESVMEMTSHQPNCSRFQHLLAHAEDLKKRYDDGYKLFASGFSYEKVRDQVESVRVEYVARIHKVFSDIQNQLLGIPVSTIIVATQMKNAQDFGYEFWVNIAVLLGCWVFAILMVFILQNQSHTLGVINIEIKRQKRQLEKEYASVADTFNETFSYLSRRAATQRLILLTIDAFVVGGLILSHVVFLKLTPPAKDCLLHYWSYLSQILWHVFSQP